MAKYYRCLGWWVILLPFLVSCGIKGPLYIDNTKIPQSSDSSREDEYDDLDTIDTIPLSTMDPGGN